MSVNKSPDTGGNSQFWREAKNWLLSFVEAAAIIAISQVGFIFFCIRYFLSTPGTSPNWEEVKNLIFLAYGYGDLLGLLSGLFASSVVFFIVNGSYFRNRPVQLLAYVAGPLVLLAFVSPLQNGAAATSLKNEPFVLSYAATVTVLSFVVWIVCLWRQRTLDDSLFDPNKGARNMMNGVE